MHVDSAPSHQPGQCGNGDGADEEEQRSGSSSHHKVSLLTLYRRLDRHHPKDPGKYIHR